MSENVEPVEPVEPDSVDVVDTKQEDVSAEPEIVDVVESKPEPVKPKYGVPIPVNIDDVRSAMPEPAGPAVVSNGVTDEVLLSACVYKNEFNRKSLSVHHLQRRLAELGFPEAKFDRDGYFGDLTKAAIGRFQVSKGLSGSGNLTTETFLAIFEGDPNVTVLAV
jgi:hypothetical protein